MVKVLDRLLIAHPQLFPDKVKAKEWETTLEGLIKECYSGDDSPVAILETALLQVATRAFKVGREECLFNGLMYAKCCAKMIRIPEVWISGLLPTHDCKASHPQTIVDRDYDDILLPTSLSVEDAKKMAPEYEKRALTLNAEVEKFKESRRNLIMALGAKI